MKNRFSLLVLSCFVFQVGSQIVLICQAEATQVKGKISKTNAAAVKKQTPYPAEFYEAEKLCQVEKKYKEAYDILDQLDREGFCRDKTHYYMALCLHHLNQLQAAAQNYLVVYRYSKDRRLKYLAGVGYNQVKQYSSKRTYAGQGNNFKTLSSGPSMCAGRWDNDASTPISRGASRY